MPISRLEVSTEGSGAIRLIQPYLSNISSPIAPKVTPVTPIQAVTTTLSPKEAMISYIDQISGGKADTSFIEGNNPIQTVLEIPKSIIEAPQRIAEGIAKETTIAQQSVVATQEAIAPAVTFAQNAVQTTIENAQTIAGGLANGVSGALTLPATLQKYAPVIVIGGVIVGIGVLALIFRPYASVASKVI